MITTISFNKIEDHKEFFRVFQGLCNTAESAFNKLDQKIKDPTNLRPTQICKDASYLMSITFVIMGMRGDYNAFKDIPSYAFFVEIDGVEYDQTYLYKMNDYFAIRCNQMLAVLEKIDPETYKSYDLVWRNY